MAYLLRHFLAEPRAVICIVKATSKITSAYEKKHARESNNGVTVSARENCTEPRQLLQDISPIIASVGGMRAQGGSSGSGGTVRFAVPTTPISAISSTASTPASYKRPSSAVYEYVDGSDGSAVSVMSAFRDLQARARVIETGRAEALKDRDELRRELGEKRRQFLMEKGRVESHAQELMLDMRASSELVRSRVYTMHEQLDSKEGIHRAAQKTIMQHRASLQDLEAEVAELNSKHQILLRRGTSLQAEVEASKTRFETLHRKVQQLAVAASEQEAHVYAEISNAQGETQRLKLSSERSKARSHAMQKFLRILFKVNSDLCQALGDQKEAARQLKQLVIIPRHTWPLGGLQRDTVLAEIKTQTPSSGSPGQRRIEINPHRGQLFTIHTSKESKKAAQLVLQRKIGRRVIAANKRIATAAAASHASPVKLKEARRRVLERALRELNASFASRQDEQKGHVKKQSTSAAQPGYMRPKTF